MSINITMLPNPANIPKDSIWGFGQLEYTKKYWSQILWNKTLVDSIDWGYNMDSLLYVDNITLVLNFMKNGRNLPVRVTQASKMWLPKWSTLQGSISLVGRGKIQNKTSIKTQ